MATTSKSGSSEVTSKRQVNMPNFKIQRNMKALDRYYKFLHFIKHYAEKFPEEIEAICSMYNVKNLSKYLS